ncbi:MAG: hypothetical protein JWO22_2291 [Frankiales bacterium]|nr:hypothetical protein [Frankiales bacterium]
MTIRNIIRTLGATALLTPALLAVTAGAAQAQAVTSPADGTVISSTGSVSVDAVFNGCSSNPVSSCPSGTLTVTDPAGGTAGSTSKTASRGTSTTSLSLSVNVDGSTRNGAWGVTLKSGSNTTLTHFYTNVAPATPSGFSVSTTDGDPNDVFLSWSKGGEPDLQSYSLFDGSGKLLQSGITPDSACSGSTCHYALYYNNPTPGTYSYSYALSASRTGGCSSGSCPSVESGKTSTRTASLVTPSPPPPSPTPQPTRAGGTTGGGSTGGGTTGGAATSGDPTTGGSTGGSTGDASTGGTSTGAGASTGGSATGGVIKPSAGPLPTLNPDFARRATALGFNSFNASLGIPKLPPLPDTTVTLPGSETKEQQGTYNPTLPYKSVASTPTRSGGILSPIASTVGIDPEKLATSLAFALILIMSAAHLRRWIGAHVDH